jgi:hypothetical protein
VSGPFDAEHFTEVEAEVFLVAGGVAALPHAAITAHATARTIVGVFTTMTTSKAYTWPITRGRALVKRQTPAVRVPAISDS